MVCNLRKKRFPLLVKWKLALEKKYPLSTAHSEPIPPALIYHSFEEIVRLLKTPPPETVFVPVITPALDPPRNLPSSHFIDVFLTGEEVLSAYLLEEHFVEEDENEQKQLLEFLDRIYALFHLIALNELRAFLHNQGNGMKRRPAHNPN